MSADADAVSLRPSAVGVPLHLEVHNSARPSRPRLTVAVVGSGEGASLLVRALAVLADVEVTDVWTPRADTQAARAGDEIGATVHTDIGGAARQPGVDVVADASGDERTHALLAALLPADVELLGEAAVRLLVRTLGSGSHEEQRTFGELRSAVARVQAQERRWRASNAALERDNQLLDRDLAEMYFAHEFLKQLTRYNDVADVSSLIVDAAAGMFGVAIAAVYVVNRDDWTLRPIATQGALPEEFRASVPLAETILGRVAREGGVAQERVLGTGASSAWISPNTLRWQAAAPLRTGEDVVAVLVIGSAEEDRALAPSEIARLGVMADQAALALENAVLHGELQRLSATDRLTGLSNRGHFEQTLERELSRADRYGQALSLLLLDIDDFKSFNDAYGHPAGDELLRRVASVIRSNSRDMDVPARYGGEEFVIVLPETGAEGALRVAGRICSQIAEAVVMVGQGEFARRTASVGVAVFPESAQSSAELVKAADDALYRAKRAGKNRVEPSGLIGSAEEPG